MLKKLIAALALLTLARCDYQARQLDCIDGCDEPGVLVQVQPEANDSTTIVTTLVLLANRTYSPSKFNNASILVVAGEYVLPAELKLVQGAAGTGWATLQVGSDKFCYQGNGGNNSQVGSAFVLKHKKVDGSACELLAGAITAETGLQLQSEVLLSLSVNGGGLSGSLQSKGTTVQANIMSTVQL